MPANRQKFTLFALHEPTYYHLQEVIMKMRKLGPPKIRAYWRKKEKAWYALEGSHRIAAAKQLELVPVIIPMRFLATFNHDTKDVMPDKRVCALLKYYDEHKRWTRYEF